MRPRVGMARAALVLPTASARPRPVCPMARPMGIAMAAAMPTAANVYQRCSHIRTGMPSGPAQCAGSRIHCHAAANWFTRPPPRPAGPDAAGAAGPPGSTA